MPPNREMHPVTNLSTAQVEPRYQKVILEAYRKFLPCVEQRYHLQFPTQTSIFKAPREPLREPCEPCEPSANKPSVPATRARSVREDKITNLTQVLGKALNKNNIPALKQYLTEQSETKIARFQSVWRFLSCLWRPKSQTQRFLENLANNLNGADVRAALTTALTKHKYRGYEFFIIPTGLTIPESENLKQPGRLLIS